MPGIGITLGAMTHWWHDGIAADWRAALEPVAPILDSIGARIAKQNDAGAHVLPPSTAIMRAFREPLSQVRVLIVGQDPYPTSGDAMGLSFSVAPGRPMPRSLRNIAQELADDTGETLSSGDLTDWSQQGVLLLNRVLTVREANAGSHRGIGWEAVTDAAIRAVASRGNPLVAVLWGRQAQKMIPLLRDVPMISSPHPSPLSARRGFFGSRPFSRVNAELRAQGADPVIWSTTELACARV